MDTNAATRPPLCAAAPVLASLLPLIAGILAARAGLGMAFLLAVAGLSTLAYFVRAYRGRLVFWALSALAGFMIMRSHSPTPHPLWRELPPREATVQIRVEDTFNARKPGHYAGIGTITGTRLPFDTVSGQPTAFYLECDKLPPPGIGSVMECTGVLTFLMAEPNPDGYVRYLANRGIFLNLSRGAILSQLAPPPRLERLRQGLYRASLALLTAGCDDVTDPGRVLASMLLGDRSLLTDDRVELYRRTGSFHLFAVSGLHVGSVALCLHLLGSLLRIPAALRLLPVLAGTWTYVWLTGSSPSAMRAGIMVTCLGMSRYLLRQPHLFPALALSAWMVLLWDPHQLFNLGFQLSYAVVASILLTGLPLAHWVRQNLGRLPFIAYTRPQWNRWMGKAIHAGADMVCISASAGMASMPLIVQHFGLFTPGGLILGPILNPLATLSVMAGCLSLLCGPVVGPSMAGWLAQATWPLIRVMEFLLETCLRVPGTVSEREWPWPATGSCLLVVSLCLAWLLQRLRQEGLRLPPILLLLPLAVIASGLAMSSVKT